MTALYKYNLKGSAADGQTWETHGTIEVSGPGFIFDVPSLAARESFRRITAGKAVYGRPGQGCRGPYAITEIIIKAVEQ